MKIITMVGTSIFDNLIEKEVDITTTYKDLKDKNQPYEKGWESSKNKIFGRNGKGGLWKKITTNTHFKSSNISAEIQSILKIGEQEANVTVHLLATDTVLSVLAAELIKKWLEDYKTKYLNIKNIIFERPDKFITQKDSFHIIKNLRIDTQINYEKGFFNLIDVVNKIYKREKKLAKQNQNEQKESIDFMCINITAGYKAIIPILTLFAQLYKIRIKYIYNDKGLDKKLPLIEIGKLPFNLDWAVGELYAEIITDKEVRELLPEKNPLLKTLRNYQIINKGKNLTILGIILKKYINDRMVEGKTTFGYVAEYKVLEAYLRKSYEDYVKIPIRGKEYWWSKLDETKFFMKPQYNRDDSKEIRIEIDILLENNQNNQIWIEVKPASKTGLNKALKQLQQRLEFIEKTSINNVKEFFLVLYKFDFQKIRVNQQIKAIQKLFSPYNIEFRIFCFDVPVNIETEKISNKVFFENPITLNPINLN